MKEHTFNINPLIILAEWNMSKFLLIYTALILASGPPIFFLQGGERKTLRAV